ncbi:MAG: branched-chain amino acid transaminase [Chloroflexi bacterium]|nr:branched-chain amino acid transaminase [Chloroflexota bacterium]
MDQTQHAYFEGKFVQFGDAKISIATHGLNYGTAAFGGLRGYWNADQKKLFVFRPMDHYKRFLNSAKILAMNLPHTAESLTQTTIDLLKMDHWQQDVYVRPLCYKADAGIGVRLHDLRDEVSIFAVPFGAYGKNEDGAHVTMSSWRRVDDNVIPARGKISGAYANSALIKTDAIRAGFDEALVLDQNGHISEGTAMNVFMVRDGVLISPPVYDNILEGITRRTVIELAKNELGLVVSERSIDRTEAFVCEELFLTGTAAQVMVINKVDFRQVGDGKIGPITARLRELFNEVVHGRLEKYNHWNVPVE